MFVSLSGLLRRLKGNSIQKFGVEEFIKHYKQAKKSYKEGKIEVVGEFFNIYVTDED